MRVTKVLATASQELTEYYTDTGLLFGFVGYDSPEEVKATIDLLETDAPETRGWSGKPIGYGGLIYRLGVTDIETLYEMINDPEEEDA